MGDANFELASCSSSRYFANAAGPLVYSGQSGEGDHNEPPLKIPRYANENDSGNVLSETDDVDADFQNESPVAGCPVSHVLPLPDNSGDVELVPIQAVSPTYQPLFSSYQYFNVVQSLVFNDVYRSNKSVALCAPTSSGKTVVLELAIVRHLEQTEAVSRGSRGKVVYVAPTKSLCSERWSDWNDKLMPLGVNCAEVSDFRCDASSRCSTSIATTLQLTGDSVYDDEFEVLRDATLIVTTPEKWDWITRKWRNRKNSLMSTVGLMLIDEVHLISESDRGAPLEVVVTRMKTVNPHIRIVATSATAPNVDDIASWLANEHSGSVNYRMSADFRPVKLITHVYGYKCPETMLPFKFDLNLNYKLMDIIKNFSDRKPTLVFCSTRKSTESAGKVLAANSNNYFVQDQAARQTLADIASVISSPLLKELVRQGVAFHHAGLAVEDKRIVEQNFALGHIPVLLSTTTMSVGVNLPAHLVIIKSTEHYRPGKACEEYNASTINQMIGRAGRTQFGCETAIAVIMTKEQSREKYENMINGAKALESMLYKSLLEHMNAEIVLATIRNVDEAVKWVKSTFLYKRILKNPTGYGLPKRSSAGEIECDIRQMCNKELAKLKKYKLVENASSFGTIAATKLGEVMASCYVSFDTIRKFCEISNRAAVPELLSVVASCAEFSQDFALRNDEKKLLYEFSDKRKRQRENLPCIRFPMDGKIKTVAMKVSTMIQAIFGILDFPDHYKAAEALSAVRLGKRISRCLTKVLSIVDRGFISYRNALFLQQSFEAELWENSEFVVKQVRELKVGRKTAQAFAEKGFTSFASFEHADPREIENAVGRKMPFGNQLQQQIKRFPKYKIHLEQLTFDSSQVKMRVRAKMENYADVAVREVHTKNRCVNVVVGDADDRLVAKFNLTDDDFIKNRGQICNVITVDKPQRANTVHAILISESFVGLDAYESLDLFFT